MEGVHIILNNANGQTYLLTSCRQILGVGSGETRRCKINLEDEHDEFYTGSDPLME
jgi:hypothetical protein